MSVYIPRTFTPDASHHDMHNVPRFTGENSFDPSETDWFIGVLLIIVPWLILAVITTVSTCVVYLCPCCSCCVSKKKENGGGKNFLLKILFVACCLLTLAGVAFAIYGNAQGQDGVDDARTSIDSLDRSMEEAISITTTAIQLTDDFTLELDSYEDVCGETLGTNALRSAMAEAKSVLEEILDLELRVDEAFDDADKVMDTIEKLIDVLGMIVLCFGVLVVILMIVGTFLQQSGACKNVAVALRCFLLGLAIIAIFLLWVITGLTMAGSCAAGDFCVDPDESWMQFTDDEEVKIQLRYYALCEGEFPLEEDIQKVKRLFAGIKIGVQTLKIIVGGVCPQGQDNVQNMDQIVDRASVLLWQVEALIQCPTFNSPYASMAYDAVCSEWFYYLLYTFIGALLGSIFFTIALFMYDAANGREDNCCCRRLGVDRD
mmetsp:Transcript_3696/g.5502  ORF Transcript_3696/g.5502 Transcript_3696/m.5502 type:complete len:431 (+) Transcript_3696:131-1423(+)